MKKFLALIAALVMVFAVSATALADGPAGDQVHDGSLPYTSAQDAKITITGLHAGGENDGTKLPSEYHVRVKWEVTNGVYKATKTDGKDGFKNYIWDCEHLMYTVNSAGSSTDADVREGNWATKPAVSFEVTNASTPDRHIFATPSLDGTNAWAGLLKDATIEAQNTTIGTKDVPPVLPENMGSGVNSYEEGVTDGTAHNVYAYTYTFNWDYGKLNEKALEAYMNGTGTQELTNSFVVRITATATAPATGD